MRQWFEHGVSDEDLTLRPAEVRAQRIQRSRGSKKRGEDGEQ